jgi:membrane protein YqaA with SNARE-associated domain
MLYYVFTYFINNIYPKTIEVFSWIKKGDLFMFASWIQKIRTDLQNYAPRHPYKTEALFYFLSFLDAILLPVPIEFIYIWFTMYLPQKKWRMAWIAIFVGCMAGFLVYGLGYWVSCAAENSSWADWIKPFENKKTLQDYALWLIVFKPPAVLIPYKILAFFCGFSRIPLMYFIPCMIFGKMRLLLVTWWISRSKNPEQAIQRMMKLLKIFGWLLIIGLLSTWLFHQL